MHRSFSLLFAAAMVAGLAIAPTGAAAQSQSQVTLTVSVVDQADDAVGNANVTASWDDGERTRTTASNGRVFIDVPEGASVSLTVEHPDFVRNQPLVVENATQEDVTLRVSRKGESTVTVVDSEGDPLADARVTFNRDGETVVRAETGANGTVSTGVVERGEYFVSVIKPGYFRNTSTVSVGADSSHTFTLERGTVRLDVNVYDDHFDERRTLEGAQVRVEDADGVVASVRASGGSVSISVGVQTEYTVTVTKEGYVETQRTIQIREEDRSIDVATQRVPTLVVQPRNDRVVVGETTRLQVLNAYNESVEGATIRRDGEVVGTTDADGELTVTIESAGTHQFVAEMEGVQSENVTVEGFDPDASDEPTPTETSSTGAGFGVAIAVTTLVAVALLRRRR